MKIEVMKDWMHPKTIESSHGFLGITSYYINFIKNYGKSVSPLTSLI
jgi:hypothetical protein